MEKRIKSIMRKKRIWIVALLLLAICLFSYYQNNALTISSYTIKSTKLSEKIRVVQLSDLHSKEFGKNQHKLIEKVRAIQPDFIVFTGDLVDSKKYDGLVSLSLMEQLVKIAPTYFVTGNHEAWSAEYPTLEQDLITSGVQVLRNRGDIIQVGSSEINIIGLDDLDFFQNKEEMSETLNSLYEESRFNLLLSHRPELFSMYEERNINLVLSGHAHGGQVRIPWIGGVVAPDQDFFPKYTAGKYESGNTAMIVNRGLGNSIIPQRIFNQPEIVEIILTP